MENSFEEQQLKITPFDYKITEKACTIFPRNGTEAIRLPPSYSVGIKLLAESKTPHELAYKLFSGRIRFKFTSLIELLQFLCQKGIISNTGSFLERLYQLKKVFHWRPPFLRAKKISIPLTDFRFVTQAPAFVSWVLGFAVLVLGFKSLPGFWRSFSFDISTTVGFSILLQWWILNSLVFSVLSVIEAILAVMVQGTIPKLNFEISLLGCRLSFDRSIYYDDTNETLFSFLLLSLLAGYFWIYAKLAPFVVPSDSTALATIGLFSYLAFLTESSPVSENRLSEVIRLLYRSGGKFRISSRPYERVTHLLMAIWTGLTGSAFYFVWKSWDPSSGISNMAPQLLLVAAFLISFLNDVAAVGNWLSKVISVQGLWGGLNPAETFAPENLAQAKTAEELFNQFTILRTLPPEIKNRMFKHARIVVAKKGKRVCAEGQLDPKMYGVISGRLGVFKKNLNGQRYIVDLLPGSLFGEVGFFKNAKRTASVYAIEESELLQLRSPQTDQPLPEEQFKLLQDRIWLSQALISSPVFMGLPLETIDAVVSLGSVAMIKPNQKLTVQGQHGHEFFLIIQGEAQVDIDGKVIRKLSRGSVLGELALLRHTPRTTTVTALTNMEVLVIQRDMFWQLLSRNWGLGLALEEMSQSYI